MSDEEKAALCGALYFAKLSDEELQNLKDMLKEDEEKDDGIIRDCGEENE